MSSLNALWISLGLIGAFVLYLVLSSENATTFGMPNNQFAQVALMSAWGALVASAVIPGRGQLKEFARYAAIWILIILSLAAGYIFRFDLQDIASRMTAGLVPGSPRAIQSEDGRNRVILSKSDGEHFVARMNMNGATVTLLVDTGATSIVLTERDASQAGIDIQNLNYSIPSQTANGLAYFARARIEQTKLGSIERNNQAILVAKPETLNQSLLGMSFLNSLSSFEFRQDELLLTE